jgi:hypothetical protein
MITSNTLNSNAAQLIVGGPNNDVAITCIQFCNITNTTNFEVPSTVNVDVYLVPAGLSAVNGTLIYSKVPITAGDTFIVDAERMILGINDSLWAKVDLNNSVVCTISSVGM